MDSFEDIARKFLEAVTSDLDVHTSIKGEIVKNNDTSFSLLTPDHIQFAYAGRGPGKKPPLQQMLDLVESKNILFDGLDKRGTAFAIQASIGAKGTSNWDPNAGDLMEETVAKYQDQYARDLGKQVLVTIDNKLKDEMEKMWAEEKRILKDFKI
tara:strand:- start:4169 stop:4630 length:462 start_codon:yes stop_codon:yes gene_type:complete